MRLRGAAALLVLALGLAAPAPARAEMRVMQAVGAVAIDPANPPSSPLRDLALEHALRDAIERVAVDMVADPDSESAGARVAEALGDEPLDYANRFRILEDRGRRPALYSSEAGVEEEYLVLVEVHVNVDRVRSRLAAAGLLAGPSARLHSARTWVVLQDLDGYAPYAAVRRLLLGDPQVSAVQPVELARGRAVLRVDADRSAEELVRVLQRSAGPELRIEPLRSERDTVVLRVSASPAPGPAIDRTYILDKPM